MNEPEKSLRGIFNEAVELVDAAERNAFLQRACDDDALRRRVENLLRAHEQADVFLENPAAGSPARTLVVNTAMVQSTQKPGDKISHYKLLQQIGEGGCGVVYMAEQEEPVRRRVALKVIKLGMDTKQVIARFEAERQALALMDHPNIAKVFDAGATDTGRPYFVMELVRGIRITDYCDQNNLSTTDRLKLFTQVCNAIQHAHQKGIIHRDIKPSNILVTLHDGVPVPKVIDFGIAKATDQRLTDKTVFTAFEQFMGTPAYMSPEQAEMSGLDIDTRSDIYALGVLLYELLTGKTPFDAKELMAAGLDAMRRTIREKEPARPSTCLSTMLNADLATVAKHRQSDAPKLVHLLRGDLDWIVMKTLEKDRTRRYETANGLAIDIQRHLQNEPVVARPPSNLYRFQKLVRRNKLAVAATGAVAAALIIGLGLSTWMFFKEKEARQRAVVAEKVQSKLRLEAEIARQNEAKLRQKAEADEAKAKLEANKSQQVAQFLKDMLNAVDPAVSAGRDTTMLREILDKTAERLSKDLTNQPEVEAELRLTIGRVYLALGRADQAEAMFRPALVLWRTTNGYEDKVADSLNQLSIALRDQKKSQEAETALNEALTLERKLYGNEHSSIATSLHLLAGLSLNRRKLDEAESLYRQALVMRRKLFGDEHDDVAASINNLALVLAYEGKPTEVESMRRQALAIYIKLHGNDHPGTAWCLTSLGQSLLDQNKLAEAETAFNNALTLNRKLFGNGHSSIATSLQFLADVLQRQGKHTEVETLYQEHLVLLRNLFGNEHSSIANSLHLLAGLSWNRGKLDEAEGLYRQALDMRRKLLGNDHPDTAWSRRGLSEALAKQNKLAEAVSMSLEALAVHRKLLDHSSIARTMGTLLNLARRYDRGQGVTKDEAAADKLYREVAQQYRQDADQGDINAQLNLAGMYDHGEGVAKDAVEAAKWYRKVAEQYRKKAEGGDPLALNNVAWFLAVNGNSESRDGRSAITFAEKAVAATNRKEPSYLDTLSAAYAEASQFEKAISAQKEAIALLKDEKTKAEFLSRLKLYESNSPYREAESAEVQNIREEFLKKPSVTASSILSNVVTAEIPVPQPLSIVLSNAVVTLPKPILLSASEAASRLPSRDSAAPPELLDLSAFYNADPAAGWNDGNPANNLASLPRGLQTFGGIRFDVRGLIQLACKKPISEPFPPKVDDIKVNRACRRMHFLHATCVSFGTTNGTEVGQFVIRQTGLVPIPVAIRFGLNIRDWQVHLTQQPVGKDPATIAWTGTNSSGQALQLFTTTWENSHPDVKVESLDYRSNMSTAAPFLIAITLE